MTTQTETISTQTRSTPRITIETALWGGIAIAALAIRLAALTHFPLNEPEAAQSLAALSVYHGEIPAGNYSPLLTTLMSGAFVLFGATDWAARLVNVLLGVALVLLPLGLRRELGRGGALIAAALLAISGTATFFSRTVNPDMAAAVGALLALVGVVRYQNERDTRGLFAIAGGAAILLTAGSSGFTALAIALIAIVMALSGNKSAMTMLREQFAADRATVRRAGFWFGTLAFLFATAATFNFNGAGGITEQFSQWIAAFGITPRAGFPLPGILNLVLYEPVLLIFGSVGIAAAITGKNTLRWMLAAWAALAVLLDVFTAGRTGGQTLLAVVPLALLAGMQLDALWRGWRSSAKLEADGVLLGVTLIVLVFSYVSGASWSLCTAAQAGCNTAWILPAAGIALIFGLTAIFGAWYGKDTAFRGLAVLALVSFGALAVGFSWRLNFGEIYDAPFELAQVLPASTRLPVMLAEIEQLSMHRWGDEREINIAVVDADVPQIRWYLRNYPNTNFVPDFATASGTTIILARPQSGEPAGNYLGEEFALVSFWSPAKLAGKDWVRWYIYRHLPNHNPGHDQMVLWVKQN